MRKILFLFLSTLLASVPLYLLLRPAEEPMRLSSPPPAQPVPAAEPTPIASLSRVFLPIDVPLATIRARLEREVPITMQGESADPVRHKAVIDDTLRWHARRGPLQLAGQGDRLDVRVATLGDAQVSGKVRPVRGSLGKLLRRATGGASDVPFRVHAKASATLTAVLRPAVAPDWRILPNVTAQVDVQRAEVPVAGLARVDVRPTVRAALQRKVDEQLARLRQRLAQDQRLHRLAGSAWAALHRVQQVTDDPRSWLVVTPVGIAATPIRVDSVAIRMGLEVTAETRLVIADAPPANAPGPLPALATTGRKPGYLEVNTRASASWDRLNRALATRLADRRLAGADGTRIGIRRAEITPWGEGVLLTLDLDARRDPWYRASGRVYLTGRPRLDAATQVLHFDDLDFVLETRHALASAARWLMASTILDQITQSASLDLAPHIQRAKAEAAEAIERYVRDGPDNVTLTAQLHDINVTELAVTEHDLQIGLNARADVRAEITSLDF